MVPHESSFIARRVFLITAAIFLIICNSPLTAPLSASAHGQTSTATLSGIVMDEAGAVIPDVRITLLNLSTALQRHDTTNANGEYVVPLLPPGRYNVTAQRDGFTTVEIRNVVLNTGDQLALRIKLKIGEVGESVIIVEDPLSIQESVSLGTVVNRRFVENLPLNGRSFQTLFHLAPGVVLTRAAFDEQGQFSVNGQRANANYFMVDGVSANFGVSAGSAPGQSAGGSLPALTALGTTSNLISVDALEEFRILTSAYAPEFGRVPGAQVSLITRSGTNEFHGTLYDYFRNDALDANDWFGNSNGLNRPAIRQNDFGAVLGGPIIRNQILFFSSYEGLRLRLPQVARTEVPSLGAREVAPPVIKPFLNAFPIPNGPETQNGLAEFVASYSDPSNLNAASLRVDWFRHERLAMFGRFNQANSETTQRGSKILPGFSAFNVVDPTIGQSLNTLSRAELSTVTSTVGATFTINDHTINDFRANWSQARGRTSFTLDGFGGAVVPPDSLLFPTLVTPKDAGFQFLAGSGTNTNLMVGRNVDNQQRQVNVVDSLALTRGSHQLKFGVDYRRLTPVFNSLRYSQSVIYDGITGDTGPSPGTILSGIAKSVQVFAGAEPRFPVFTNLSIYGQDSFRVTPRLSLTWGVRWEFSPPPKAADGRDPMTVQGLDEPQTITLAPLGTALWKTTYGNFAPRVGLAYQLSSAQGRELVLRAGLGVFYDLGNGQAAQGFGSVFPFVAVKGFTNVPFPLTPEQAAPPPLSLSPPVGTIVVFDPNLKLPQIYQGNVAFEKSLTSNQTLSVAYVAALGRRLLREDALLSPNPNFALVRVTRNAADSSYHAMQIQYGRRLSRGLQALASYTWSHSIDNASSDSASRLRGIIQSAPGGSIIDKSRGPSDFDIRQSLTAAVTYNLLAPRLTRLANAILDDWSIDFILRARTAAPVNVVLRSDLIGEDLFVELQRPDSILGVPLYINDPIFPGGRRINRAAFRAPLQPRQGTLGYNALRGFGMSQLDLALRRQFHLGEHLNLQLKAEIFNLFNHPNFGGPVNTLSSNLFGQSTLMLGRSLGTGGINGGLSPLYQIGGPRSIQLALKLQF